MKNKIKNNSKSHYHTYILEILVLILTFLIFFISLFSQNSCSFGIISGIQFCINTLVPSLFMFIVISSFITISGISDLIGKIFSTITKFLFYLPGCAGAAIILGWVGGYPTGAKSVQTMLSKNLISQEQANRMMKFTVGAGPAFIISTVGGIMLKSKTIGLIIFISQISVSLVIGILLGVNSRIKKLKFYEIKNNRLKINKLSTSLIAACGDAAESTINMCALVVLFSAIFAILNDIKINNTVENILSSLGIPNSVSRNIIPIFLEVNSGCISSINSYYPAVFMSFAIGWAGLCVHFQIISIFSQTNGINIKQFTLFRFIQACLSSLITHITLCILNPSINAMSIPSYPFNPIYTVSVSSSLQGGIALILICTYFLYDFIKLIPEKSKSRLSTEHRIKFIQTKQD